MATTNLHVSLRKRWFFWPALVATSLLGRVGVLKSPERAAKWIAEHAMRIEVR